MNIDTEFNEFKDTSFNSNKAGFFEGSFSWRGQFTPVPLPPTFIFQKELN